MISFVRAIWQRVKSATGGAGLTPAIRDELVHLQYARIGAIVPGLYFAIALIAVMAGAASSDKFDILYNVLLPGGFVLLGSYRCLVWYRRKSMAVNTPKMRRYLRATIWIALGMALVGGLWSVDAYLDTREARRILSPVFIFMVVFVGAVCLISMPRAAIGVMIVALAPTLAIMAQSNDAGIQAMAICFTIVSVLTMILIVNSFNEIVSGLVLRHELKRLSETDPLTGLANRRAFLERFIALNTGAAPPPSIAIVMIDLDGFKQANDRFGHAAGDAILVQAGERLRLLCPDAASVARLGGDEFALLIETDGNGDYGTALKSAVQTALSLPYGCHDRQITISASVGSAHARKGDISLDALMREADGELYRAKHGAASRLRA
ncbi:diguanylate cyclase [Blastomonas sp.]|uniref:GGDEF domain-containing protein n=1 Tax=Blastomonas sp. TaxID=1909299 RepID=UPI003593D6BC